jgi:hypothetical protein
VSCAANDLVQCPHWVYRRVDIEGWADMPDSRGVSSRARRNDRSFQARFEERPF